MIRLAVALLVVVLRFGFYAKGIFHKAHGVPYHFENSFRGIIYAARRGFRRIDLDLNMTQDGVIVDTHWLRPMLHDGFFDRTGKMVNKQLAVNQMTWADGPRCIRHLRTKDGYEIRSLEQALHKCAQEGIDPKLEPKADHRFENAATWVPVKALCNELGLHVSAYTLRTLGGAGAGARRAKAMRAAGIPCAVIH